jgi:hypothetical protein
VIAKNRGLGPFRLFSKFRGDIRTSRCTTGGVNDTGGQMDCLDSGHLWKVELTYRSILRCNTSLILFLLFDSGVVAAPGLVNTSMNFRKNSK